MSIKIHFYYGLLLDICSICDWFEKNLSWASLIITISNNRAYWLIIFNLSPLSDRWSFRSSSFIGLKFISVMCYAVLFGWCYYFLVGRRYRSFNVPVFVECRYDEKCIDEGQSVVKKCVELTCSKVTKKGKIRYVMKRTGNGKYWLFICI